MSFKILRYVALSIFTFVVVATIGQQKAHATFWTSAIFKGPINEIQDRDAETGFNPTTGAQITGTLNTGDLFGGIVQFSTITNLSNSAVHNIAPGNIGGFDEGTAFFLAVATKTATGSTFTFSFSPASQSQWTSVFGAPASGIATGTMIRLMDDPLQDFSRSGTLSSSIGTATNGTFIADLGFSGPGGSPVGGQGWEAINVPSDNLAFFSTFTGNSGASVNVGVDALSGFTGFTFGDLTSIFFGGPAQFVGTGSITGIKGVSTHWSAFSAVTIDFHPTAIPEPSSLLLMGIGVLSFGVVARWRRRKLATS